MRASSLLFFYFLSVSVFFSQTTSVLHMPITGDAIYVDGLQKIYSVKENAIIKYTPEGKQMTNYSNLLYGNIHFIDTRNSLQTMVFYKEQQKIILLDNMLGETGSISLSSNFEWIDLVCLSNRDNGFWLYDINNQMLVKTNDKLEVIHALENIGQLLSVDLNPSQIVEKNETVYLFDTIHGVYQFDIFGNYKKHISIKEANKIQIQDNLVFSNSKGNIDSYNMLSFEKNEVLKPTLFIKDYCISSSYLYIQNENEIIKYRL